ncbi:MAG: hypothetical protein GY811_16230 [Myxococcales bacterium]|nr:hypothetical protein [Myxococcales bacterium]
MTSSAIRELRAAKQALVPIHKENERLHKRIAKQAEQIATILGESGDKHLTEELLRLKEQMAMLQHSLFGLSSERRGGDDPTSSTDATPEHPDSPSTGASEDSSSSDAESDTESDKKSGKKNRQLDLPTVEISHALADDDQACDHCGGQLAEWEGQFEEFEEVDVVERIYRIVKHRREDRSTDVLADAHR